ncbi:hypothetical protein K7X08_031088 [Anisodus acutangulus]|uniref:RING-type domain-containing protein n=1 Tax=Anisodus acutangulus TaxID=402998 RepID=A0A9Q1ML10_9SOLA|nr:hypothetical protein K7X08_031088 [Anisodus acutangulus]
MGMAGESSSMTSYSGKLKKAAKKILVQTCGSFSCSYQNPPPPVPDNNNNSNTSEFSYPASNNLELLNLTSVIKPLRLDSTTITPSNKNFCPICLDPLSYSCDSSPGQAIFTAQCSHAFHFACISSNIRHGNVTCPVCRAHWTQLPRTLKMHYSPHNNNQADPILQILDESIATSRVHRRSFLRSARYDDDDPVEPDPTLDIHRLHLSLSPVPHSTSVFDLCLKLTHQPATDLVLVASPNGPHLRLMKQAMAFVVFSLRPIDRLAIVTYSSAAARIFPLKCMTSYGKRTALQVIDRLFYMGQADPIEGLKKGVKILRERTHQNTHSFILHLSDNPTRSSSRGLHLELPVTIHKFHVGFGFGTSNGFVMHEFERFLAKILCGAVREIALRIGDDTRILRLGELPGGEERRIPLILEELDGVRVVYTYIDCMMNDSVKTGEIVVGIGDRKEMTDVDDIVESAGRSSSVESWEYHDPFMARRWAKRLHGYRI